MRGGVFPEARLSSAADRTAAVETTRRVVSTT